MRPRSEIVQEADELQDGLVQDRPQVATLGLLLEVLLDIRDLLTPAAPTHHPYRDAPEDGG